MDVASALSVIVTEVFPGRVSGIAQHLDADGMPYKLTGHSVRDPRIQVHVSAYNDSRRIILITLASAASRIVCAYALDRVHLPTQSMIDDMDVAFADLFRSGEQDISDISREIDDS